MNLHLFSEETFELWFDSCKQPPPISDHSYSLCIQGGRLQEV